ncbi:MAG: LPS export ABC transporter permease LptG [Chlorobiaceae bacterium]|nr:LPS export ABC transporter permease LptG [Chlorobiaceae bacterium]
MSTKKTKPAGPAPSAARPHSAWGMNLVDRYIARQFLVTFLFALASFAALFILINLVENLDVFMDRHVAVGKIILFYLSGLPDTFLLTTPLSVLLASLFVTGKLSMQCELPALKSAGVSLARLMKPFLAVALLITCVNMLNSCLIAPSTYEWSKGFEKRHLKSKKNDNEGPLHIRESRDRILTVGEIGPDRRSASFVSLEEFNGSSITTRIDADSMKFIPSGKRWVFYNTKTRYFSAKGERLVTNTATDTLKLSLSKETFRMIDADPDEMNIVQHFNFIQQKEKSGLSGLERAKVKLQTKMALPFASIIIVLIGVPLSTKKKRSGLALEAAISLLIGFLYLGMSRTLSGIGYNGLIDPLLAAWLPNILFLLAGALLYRSANE